MNTAWTPASSSAADASIAADPGPGERAAHEAGVEHAGPHDVVDEGAAAGEQPGVLDAVDPGPGVARRGLGGRHPAAPSGEQKFERRSNLRAARRQCRVGRFLERLDQPVHRPAGLVGRGVEPAAWSCDDGEREPLHGGGDERRRELLGVDAVLAAGASTAPPSACGRTWRATFADLRLQRGTVVRGGEQLEKQRGAPRIRRQLPPRPQRLGRLAAPRPSARRSGPRAAAARRRRGRRWSGSSSARAAPGCRPRRRRCAS